jgi:hypothetical protein
MATCTGPPLRAAQTATEWCSSLRLSKDGIVFLRLRALLNRDMAEALFQATLSAQANLGVSSAARRLARKVKNIT